MAIGQRIKKTKKLISKNKIRRKIIRSATITNVFINIPIAIEKITNPFLYSFFQGLKYVVIRRGKDRSMSKDLFKEEKKLKISRGASRYQNFKKIKGKDK